MKINYFLFLLFVFGALLRFYRLGDVPFGFHRDEAFLGYNAYSILITGKDISGNFLPLHLKSFLFSPAFYSYFSIPFIKIFDLNAFSVRFASALFGSLTILVTYFLTRELLNYSLGIRNLKLVIPTIAAAILAISPWHINLSRTATENTIVVFLVGLGVLIYLIAVNNNKRYLLLVSFFCFFITLFIYQAPRAFLPFFIPLLILLYPKVNNTKAKMVKIILFFITILLPLLIIFNTKDLSLRIRTVSIFATEETQLTIDEQIRTDGVFQTPVLLTRIFHNKPIMYMQQFLDNYFSHFSYSFLFADKSFPDRYRVPLVGLLYVLELPLILIGTFRLIKDNKRLAMFLIGWIAIVPIGSALTFDDVPNLQRTLLVFPALSMIEALGLLQLIKFIRTNYWLKILGFGFTLIFIYNIVFYLHQYYSHALRYRPWYRQDGYKELVEKVNNLLRESKKAVITDRESSPTIFFLFYSIYSPIKFQNETKNTKMKDFDRISFGKLEFSQEECPLKMDKNGVVIKEKDVVYVNSGLCKDLPIVAKAQIKRQDGSEVFKIY